MVPGQNPGGDGKFHKQRQQHAKHYDYESRLRFIHGRYSLFLFKMRPAMALQCHQQQQAATER